MLSQARASTRLAASLKLEFRRIDATKQDKGNYNLYIGGQANLSRQDLGIMKPLFKIPRRALEKVPLDGYRDLFVLNSLPRLIPFTLNS